MPQNVSSLRSEVRAWLSTDDKRLPDDRLHSMINGVLADLSRRADLSEFEESTALTFLTDSSTFMDNEPWPVETSSDGTQYRVLAAELPERLSRIHSVFYMNSGSPVYLEQITFEEFQDTYKSTDPDYPVKYALWADRIYFGPAPLETLTVYVYYWADPVIHGDVTAGEVSTSGALVKYWDVILPGVVAEATKYSIEDQRYQLFKSDYETKVRRLLIQEARRPYAGNRPVSEIP